MSQRLFEGVGEKDSGPEQGTAEYRVGSGAGQASRGVLFLGTSLQRSAPTRICKQPPPVQGKSPKPAVSKQKLLLASGEEGTCMRKSMTKTPRQRRSSLQVFELLTQGPPVKQTSEESHFSKGKIVVVYPNSARSKRRMAVRSPGTPQTAAKFRRSLTQRSGSWEI